MPHHKRNVLLSVQWSGRGFCICKTQIFPFVQLRNEDDADEGRYLVVRAAGEGLAHAAGTAYGGERKVMEGEEEEVKGSQWTRCVPQGVD